MSDDITKFGFDVSLNIPTQDTGTPVVYDGINDAIATQQITAGGNLQVKNITVAGISKMVAPGDDLQAAINAVNTSGGGSILFKKGTYTIRTNLTGYSSISFIGTSASDVILDFQGAVNLSFAGTNAYTTGTITVASGVNITGTGTSWLANVTTNHQLFLGTRWYRIAAVTSDTTLILAEAYGDNVTLPSTYRAVIPKVDINFKEITLKDSTTIALQFNDCRNIILDNVVAQQNSVGIALTNVSEISFKESNTVASSSDGVQMTNVGLGKIVTFASDGNTGNGFTLNNVKTVSFDSSDASANGGDGVNGTTVVNCDLLIAASGNGGQGIEFVSGCNDNFVNFFFVVGNASDGIKLTATSSNNTIGPGQLKTNGGYGINIAASSCSNNVILLPFYSGNVSGMLNDSGTGTTVALSSSNTFKNGTATRGGNTASGTQTITHGLGTTPKFVRLTVEYSTTGIASRSTGVYNGATNSSTYAFNNGTGGTYSSGNDTTNGVHMEIVAGGTQLGVITFDSTNISIAWTLNSGLGAGTMNILWEAIG